MGEGGTVCDETVQIWGVDLIEAQSRNGLEGLVVGEEENKIRGLALLGGILLFLGLAGYKKKRKEKKRDFTYKLVA